MEESWNEQKNNVVGNIGNSFRNGHFNYEFLYFFRWRLRLSHCSDRVFQKRLTSTKWAQSCVQGIND